MWVGFIACFGMATETGIIMLVYLREAIEQRGGLEKIGSLAELREAVIEGRRASTAAETADRGRGHRGAGADALGLRRGPRSHLGDGRARCSAGCWSPTKWSTSSSPSGSIGSAAADG